LDFTSTNPDLTKASGSIKIRFVDLKRDGIHQFEQPRHDAKKNAAATTLVQGGGHGVQCARISCQGGSNEEAPKPQFHRMGFPVIKANGGHAYVFLTRSPGGAFLAISIQKTRRSIWIAKPSNISYQTPNLP
jgi:hypothetical protein